MATKNMSRTFLLDMLNDFFDAFVVDTLWNKELYWGSLGYAKEARRSSGLLGGLLGGHVFKDKPSQMATLKIKYP